MTGQLAPPPDPDTATPTVLAPPGAVDAHLHLFGPAERFPFIDNPPYRTGDALAESCLAMHRALGIDHGVIVSGGAYGRNHDQLRYVLERYPEHFRGVIVPPPALPDGELAELDRLGVRGIRFVGDSAGAHVAHIEPAVAEQVFEYGWHVQAVLQAGELDSHASRLLALPNDLVLDHFAGIEAAAGLDQPAVRLLLRLLETGRVWVKLSGPNYCSREPLPWPAVTPLARLLVRAAPERLVWGTDWPHLHMGAHRMPNDAELLDLLADWVPEPGQRDRILGANARQLYRIPEPVRRTPGRRHPSG